MDFIKDFDKFKTTKVNESVMKVDDTYKVKMVCDVPQSLINALVRKVKDESEKNAREFWSDIDIAEEVAKYLTSNFMNIENLPASILMGETDLNGSTPAAQPAPGAQAAQGGAQGGETPAQPVAQAQPEVKPELPEAQPEAQAQTQA